MSLASRAGDLIYTFRFLRLLTTPFEETTAFKLGIIDAEGKRIKSKEMKTDEEYAAYNSFHRLVFNLKKLMAKAGASGKFASYAAALFLLKENFVGDSLPKVVKDSGLDPIDFLNEEHEWYLLPNKQLSPGIYRVRHEKLLSNTLDEVVLPKDKIRIKDGAFPISSILGIDIYEATHINTNQPIHVAIGEIYK